MTVPRIHLVDGSVLHRYQEKRRLNLSFLAPQVRLDRWLPARGVQNLGEHEAHAGWVAFHSWRPGFLQVDDDERAAIEALRGGRADGSALARLEHAGWLADGVPDLGAITVRAIVDFAALQNPWELEHFLGRVAERRPRTVVEIGTSSGGLLYAIAQLSASDATFISVDVPEPFESAELVASVPDVLRAVMLPAQRLHLIRERSTLHATREDVRRILAGRSVDLLVIDGDHSYGGVRSDFEMYAELVGPGGMIALHDVMIDPSNSPRGFEVGIFWSELARARPTETIVDPKGVPGLTSQTHVPARERQAAAFGFGLILT